MVRRRGGERFTGAVTGLFRRFLPGLRRADVPGDGPSLPDMTTRTRPPGPPRPADPDFQPRPTSRDRHGNLTDGTYRVSSDANRRHMRGTAPEGKSIYNDDVDPDEITMTSAQYADQRELWTGEIPGQPSSFSNKAKVEFDQDVGHHSGTDQQTNVVNVYRKKNGTIHSSPGSRLDD